MTCCNHEHVYWLAEQHVIKLQHKMNMKKVNTASRLKAAAAKLQEGQLAKEKCVNG